MVLFPEKVTGSKSFMAIWVTLQGFPPNLATVSWSTHLMLGVCCEKEMVGFKALPTKTWIARAESLHLPQEIALNSKFHHC